MPEPSAPSATIAPAASAKTDPGFERERALLAAERHRDRTIRRARSISASMNRKAAESSKLRRDYRKALGSGDEANHADRPYVVNFSRRVYMLSPLYRSFIRRLSRLVIGRARRHWSPRGHGCNPRCYAIPWHWGAASHYNRRI